jgi:hypothetical protein
VSESIIHATIWVSGYRSYYQRKMWRKPHISIILQRMPKGLGLGFQMLVCFWNTDKMVHIYCRNPDNVSKISDGTQFAISVRD